MSAPRIAWVISDGKPGHYNQSRGVVLALERLFPLQTEWVDVRLRSGLWRKPLTAVLNATTAPLAPLLALAYALPPLPAKGPDFIIVAGGRAVFAAILLARRYRAQVLYCGSLRKLQPGHFAAAMTLEPQAAHPANLVLDLPPTLIDRGELARRGAALRRHLGAEGTRLWAILVGGDGAGFRYRDAEWERLGQALSKLAAEHQARLLITTSRRSGKDAERALRASIDPSRIADAVWYGEAARAVTPDYLGAADIVFATGDSMSMLMETVAAGRPLYALEPTEARPDARFAQALARLSAKGRLIRMPIATLASAVIDRDAFTLQAEDPADALAQRLAERIGADMKPAASMKMPKG